MSYDGKLIFTKIPDGEEIDYVASDRMGQVILITKSKNIFLVADGGETIKIQGLDADKLTCLEKLPLTDEAKSNPVLKYSITIAGKTYSLCADLDGCDSKELFDKRSGMLSKSMLLAMMENGLIPWPKPIEIKGSMWDEFIAETLGECGSVQKTDEMVSKYMAWRNKRSRAKHDLLSFVESEGGRYGRA